MLSGGQLVALFALAIPIVAIVMNHMTGWRKAKAQGLSEGAAAELAARASGLEERVGQLERILDAESPGWRARH
ncbi:envelope stress response membrane protein PspB [Rhodocista pekingensis]|uniref:Envelope stress response membrane protein PspB n=1 Tax=Rhodocista pekingensis TaxID=201185 RepID=A0ABW2KVQ1_9PROT